MTGDTTELARKQAIVLYEIIQIRAENGLKPNSKTFKQLAEIDLAYMSKALYQKTGKRTYRDYTFAINKYLIPFFGSYDINDITQQVLEDFDSWRISEMGKVPMASTKRNHASAYNRIINLARDELELFKKAGNLTDVYSKEFFDRQPTYDEDPDAPFYKNGMEYIEELEAEPSENAKPKNHLLFICVDEYKKELIDELLAVYRPLAKHFEEFHKPDFVILNLYTKQMLCVGFGRKNRIFAYDPRYEPHIDFFGLTGSGDQGKYLDEFMEHDCYETVRDFAQALATLSEAMFDWDHLPHNPEMLEIALDDGTRSDGLYYVEDDEDGYEKEDIESYLEQYQDAQNRKDQAIKVISTFFPDQDWWELNTGDY